MRRSCIAPFALMLTGMLMVAGPASAEQKTGCPASPVEVWEELSVETMAAVDLAAVARPVSLHGPTGLPGIDPARR